MVGKPAETTQLRSIKLWNERRNLQTDTQKKDMLSVLLSKIKIIINGARKRKNIKIIRIYKFKEIYWLNRLKVLNE